MKRRKHERKGKQECDSDERTRLWQWIAENTTLDKEETRHRAILLLFRLHLFHNLVSYSEKKNQNGSHLSTRVSNCDTLPLRKRNKIYSKKYCVVALTRNPCNWMIKILLTIQVVQKDLPMFKALEQNLFVSKQTPWNRLTIRLHKNYKIDVSTWEQHVPTAADTNTITLISHWEAWGELRCDKLFRVSGFLVLNSFFFLKRCISHTN